MARRARAFEHHFVVLAFEIVGPGAVRWASNADSWGANPAGPDPADLIPDLSAVCPIHNRHYRHRRLRQIFVLDAKKHCGWIACRIGIGAMAPDRRHVLPLPVVKENPDGPLNIPPIPLDSNDKGQNR